MSKKAIIKPLADRVVVLPDPIADKTESGIYLAETAKEKPIRGTVIAVADGTKDQPMVVKVGDIVLYGKHAGTEIMVGDKPMLIMPLHDIFAII